MASKKDIKDRINQLDLERRQLVHELSELSKPTESEKRSINKKKTALLGKIKSLLEGIIKVRFATIHYKYEIDLFNDSSPEDLFDSYIEFICVQAFIQSQDPFLSNIYNSINSLLGPAEMEDLLDRTSTEFRIRRLKLINLIRDFNKLGDK